MLIFHFKTVCVVLKKKKQVSWVKAEEKFRVFSEAGREFLLTWVFCPFECKQANVLLFDVRKTTCWWRMCVSRCQVDLSTLSKEQTHKLEMPLEEGEGYLVLLVTLTASAAVTISDLSISSLEDQKEREEILKRYVWSSLSSFVSKILTYIKR